MPFPEWTELVLPASRTLATSCERSMTGAIVSTLASDVAAIRWLR